MRSDFGTFFKRVWGLGFDEIKFRHIFKRVWGLGFEVLSFELMDVRFSDPLGKMRCFFCFFLWSAVVGTRDLHTWTLNPKP